MEGGFRRLVAVIAVVVAALAGFSAQAEQGDISTFAGGSFLSDDGVPAQQSWLYGPSGVRTAPDGSIYIADSDKNRVRRIDPAGRITTIAGTGAYSFGGDNGPALSAKFRKPSGLAMDSLGNIYVTDVDNHRVRKIDTSGTITTFAGTSLGYSGDGGPATIAKLKYPIGIAVDGSNNVYVTELSHRIRRIDTEGIITTFAGIGYHEYSGDGGPASSAGIPNPYDVALDPSGAVWIAQRFPGAVRRITPDGIINTVTTMSYPIGLAVGPAEQVFVSENYSNRIFSVTVGGAKTWIGGNSFTSPPGPEGVGAKSTAMDPMKGSFDSAGNYYFADYSNNRVRRIDAAGLVWTTAGLRTYVGDGGPAASAVLSEPQYLAVDREGVVYISDPGAHRIRRVGVDGVITTVAGTGTPGSTPTGGSALGPINTPRGITIAPDGNVVFAEFGNGRIRKIEDDGTLSQVGPALSSPWAVAFNDSGTLHASSWGGWIYYLDGQGIWRQRLSSYVLAASLAFDESQTLYFTDVNTSRVYASHLSERRVVVGYAGYPGYEGDGGLALMAAVNDPMGLTFTANGELLIADTENHVIRRVASNGTISTIAGTGVAGFAGDGGAAKSAQFNGPVGLATAPNGDLYVADSLNGRIRRILNPSSFNVCFSSESLAAACLL